MRPVYSNTLAGSFSESHAILHRFAILATTHGQLATLDIPNTRLVAGVGVLSG